MKLSDWRILQTKAIKKSPLKISLENQCIYSDIPSENGL